MAAEGKRGFWLHQIAEYIVGLAFVATGMQTTSPFAPTVLGALVLVNAATVVDGPFSAFRKVKRRVHRFIDMAIIGAIVTVTIVVHADTSVRLMNILFAAVLSVMTLNTDYSPRVRRERLRSRDIPADPNSRSDRAGRKAGRMAGTAAAKARQAMSDRRNDNASRQNRS